MAGLTIKNKAQKNLSTLTDRQVSEQEPLL